jgi:hypothetical protein
MGVEHAPHSITLQAQAIAHGVGSYGNNTPEH